MKKVLCFLFIVSTTACGVSLRDKLVLSVQASEGTLGIVQDSERSLFQLGKVSPAAHQKIAADLAKGFQAELDAAQSLKTWKKGDKVPVSIGTISTVAEDITKIIADLGGPNVAPDVNDLLLKIKMWLGNVVSILKSFGVTVSPAILSVAQ